MANFVTDKLYEEFLSNLSQNKNNIARFLELIRDMLKQQKNYDRSLMRGLSALISHERAGGRIKTVSISADMAANEMLKEILTKSGVPFVCVRMSEPDEEIFLTKDSDEKILSLCLDKVKERLLAGTGQLDAEELIKRYSHEKIYIKRDFDIADLEVFKRNSGNVNYAVARDTEDKGQYIILYPQSCMEKIEEAIDKTIYFLSGIEGERTRELLLDAVNEKQEFMQAINKRLSVGSDVYITDSKEPSRFILLTTGSEKTFHEYTCHVDEDNKENINDKVTEIKDKSALLEYISSLSSPVLLTKKEFDLDLSKGFYEEMERLRMKMLIFPEERHFKASEDIERICNPSLGLLTRYEHLNEEAIEILANTIDVKNLSETVIKDLDVVTTGKDKPVIDEILTEYVYDKKVKEEEYFLKPLIRHEQRFYYEGRGVLNLTNFDSMPEKQYIVDAFNLGLIFEFSKEGLTVYKGFVGSENAYRHVTQDLVEDIDGNLIRDSEFDNAVLTILSNLENPVVITKEEMENIDDSEKLNELVNDKRPDLVRTKATDELMTKIFKGYSREYESLFDNEAESGYLTDKQHEASEKMKSYKKHREELDLHGVNGREIKEIKEIKKEMAQEMKNKAVENSTSLSD